MSDLELLVDTLRKPAGYVIEVCGLYISRTRTGNFRVNCVREGHECDDLFADTWDAARYFLKKRVELHLGYDVEKSVSSECYLG